MDGDFGTTRLSTRQPVLRLDLEALPRPTEQPEDPASGPETALPLVPPLTCPDTPATSQPGPVMPPARAAPTTPAASSGTSDGPPRRPVRPSVVVPVPSSVDTQLPSLTPVGRASASPRRSIPVAQPNLSGTQTMTCDIDTRTTVIMGVNPN
ncbi:merozoite surface protein CMZ-8-like [Strongylocentrotus purpuratus]|uniref:Uncharacterized protein n=1 Tax=Strongylocentrotus purpuratus TaxID=7668 RepID=A0A7M7T461_STRPU|nr:merozoite surface protein CMZ-8-like [Strongylocentrotus purpuratus]